MIDDGWVRDKLFAFAAELGAQSARQSATDASVSRIGDEMKAGFEEQRRMMADAIGEMKNGVARESAHIRGEVDALRGVLREQRAEDERERVKRREEEKRHTEELIANLRETADRAENAADRVRTMNKRIILMIVFFGACASALIENAPALLSVLGNVGNALNDLN